MINESASKESNYSKVSSIVQIHSFEHHVPQQKLSIRNKNKSPTILYIHKKKEETIVCLLLISRLKTNKRTTIRYYHHSQTLKCCLPH